ncbi:MAG: hypothetical protein H6667_25145 [Ardenticatenaceae bacterium]|nr:hypothetical protein [Ardenticatenaceae bacterium]
MLNGRDDGNRARIDLDIPTARQVRDWLTVKVKSEEIRAVDEECRLDGRVFIIPERIQCSFAIRASAEQTKQIKLLAASPTQSIHLDLEQDRALTVEEDISPESEPLSLDIYRHKENADARLIFSNCIVPEPEEDREEEKPPCRVAMQ